MVSRRPKEMQFGGAPHLRCRRGRAEEAVRRAAVQLDQVLVAIRVEDLLTAFEKRNLMKERSAVSRGRGGRHWESPPYLKREVLENLDERVLEARNLHAVSDAPNEQHRVDVGANILEQRADKD